MMMQRLNNWGRKSLIAVVVLAVTAISLIGSPEVPGKVIQPTGFDLPQVAVAPLSARCAKRAKEAGGSVWDAFTSRCFQ